MTAINGMRGGAFYQNRSIPSNFKGVGKSNIARIFFFAGNVKITFESVRVDHTTSPGPLNRVVIGRLVMPIDGAKALAKGLLDFITQQRAQASAQAQSPATKH